MLYCRLLDFLSKDVESLVRGRQQLLLPGCSAFFYLLWDRRHKGAQGEEDRRSEDKRLGRLEGEQVDGEGFLFEEFSWSIFNY